MDQAIGFKTNEMTKVIGSVTMEFYALATPMAIAGRLARAHQAAWDEVLAGRCAGAAFNDLRRLAHRLSNSNEMIELCNKRILWALTPVVGASLVCGPGEDRVQLRDIADALSHMLANALAAPQRRIAA
ncbi:MAG: hypothetical protein ACK5JM_05395 [Rhodoblastus sp.]